MLEELKEWLEEELASADEATLITTNDPVQVRLALLTGLDDVPPLSTPSTTSN